MSADDVRVEQIERYDVLDTPPRKDLQALVGLAAQICQVPSAAIHLITATEQVQVAAVGIDPSVCSREDSMCAAVLDAPTPVIVPDASRDPRFADNPFVTGAIADVRFYAATHLVTPAGVAIGTLCVFDDRPRELDEQQQLALRTLADRIIDLLELGQRGRELEESLVELEAVRDELRRSNEQLAAFAGQAAHDLRNPLTSVTLSLGMLRKHQTVAADADASWMVERALSGTARMSEMIDELLAYGQVGGELRREPVDLAEVVEQVRADLAGELDGARLTADGLPEVRGDRTQLRALLQNLVANAVKFTRPVAAPEVLVSGRPVEEGWRVEVSDNGPGVRPEDRERVFEPLVRGTEKVEGIGLGLAICSRVVRAHGGSIGLADAPGGGTAVWFELPG
jgi:signal transduction histidine kinase